MESMTGYCYLEGKTEQFSYVVSLKSLNSKYLEISMSVPRALKASEEEIEKILKLEFDRGKIELTVDFFDWAETRKVRIDYQTLKKYHDELKSICHKLKIKSDVDLSILLNLEGAVQKEWATLSSKAKNKIMRAIRDSVRTAKDMRKKEGAAIAKDLNGSLSAISKGLVEISSITKDVPTKSFLRLKGAIEKIAGGSIPDERILTEVAILAEKMDINEEKVRLADHIAKFKAIMREKGQIGKRLDFLAQEMFREINTIASKSADSKVAHIVVEMKNHVDKIREHLRNIV
ncbi:MAG: YicC family protein [Spirochaetes bacterium]|nr:YicC family protein [Spirochaetota bacterium]